MAIDRRRMLLGSMATLAAAGAARHAAAASDGTLAVAIYPGSIISFSARVAEQQGMFRKHGLNVRLIEVKGGADAVAAVVSGSCDLMLNAIDVFMLARAKNQDLVLVGGSTIGSSNVIVAHKDFPTPNLASGFPANVRDLKGAKFGVIQRGVGVETYARYVLSKAGMDPEKDVTWLAVGQPNTALPALQNRQIDAYYGNEPVKTLAVDVRGFAKVVLDTRKLPPELKYLDWRGPNKFGGLQKRINEKREDVTRFQSALKETYTFIRNPANFDTLVGIGLKFMNPDRAIVTAMLRNNIGLFGFEVDKEGVENASNLLLDFKQLGRPVTYEELVDASLRTPGR